MIVEYSFLGSSEADRGSGDEAACSRGCGTMICMACGMFLATTGVFWLEHGDSVSRVWNGLSCFEAIMGSCLLIVGIFAAIVKTTCDNLKGGH